LVPGTAFYGRSDRWLTHLLNLSPAESVQPSAMRREQVVHLLVHPLARFHPFLPSSPSSDSASSPALCKYSIAGWWKPFQDFGSDFNKCLVAIDVTAAAML
jgi:hypothetical protein